MLTYFADAHHAIQNFRPSNHVSFIILVIFDLFMFDVFYPGLFQLLFHLFFFIWVTVPVIFWGQNLSHLFSLNSWAQMVRRNLKRYYAIISFFFCEEMEKLKIDSATNNTMANNTQPATPSTQSDVSPKPQGFFASFFSIFFPAQEDKRNLTVHETFLDLYKLIVFFYQALPVYVLVLELENYMFQSIMYDFLMMIFLQFCISIQLKDLFYVSEIDKLFDMIHFSFIPAALFAFYVLIHFLLRLWRYYSKNSGLHFH